MSIVFFLERPVIHGYSTCTTSIRWFHSSWSPWSILSLRLVTSVAHLSDSLGGLPLGAQLHLSEWCFLSSQASCRWSSPVLMHCSSVWNCAFSLLSPFRRDGFSSGMPNTNPHFISRALFPSAPPRAGYLRTCHPTTRVNLPVKWKEGKAQSQQIWADEPYITRAKNMQLIGMEKQKMICA